MKIFLISIAILNFGIFYFIKNLIVFYNVYDLPDKTRKFHKIKTSSIGGLIFFLNLIFLTFYISINLKSEFIMLFENQVQFYLFFFVSSALFLIGYLDDKIDLSANLKIFFLIFLIILILFLDNNLLISELNFSFSETIYNLNKFNYLFTIFCFIAFINAFNLFDGINSQIGSYVLFILTIFFLIDLDIFILVTLLYPTIVFLIFNSKGKIFLGNAGSYLLGFIISYIFVKSYNNFDNIYADEIFFIMLFPGLDMTRLFFLRIRDKKNPFSSDRNHFHHLLLNKFNHNITLLITILLFTTPYIIFKLYGPYKSLSLTLVCYLIILYLLKLRKNFRKNSF